MNSLSPIMFQWSKQTYSLDCKCYINTYVNNPAGQSTKSHVLYVTCTRINMFVRVYLLIKRQRSVFKGASKAIV